MEDEALISKRELLERYGISYGALYRWKRMGLIPEDWFLRRSTPSGQETFFYRAQICPRMELILSRKDAVSLDKLAQELNPPANQEKQRSFLHLELYYKSYRFPLDELKKIEIVRENERIEFLDKLLKGFEEE